MYVKDFLYICKINKDMKIRFKEGERTYVMKVLEVLENGDVRVIDGSVIDQKNIIETI